MSIVLDDTLQYPNGDEWFSPDHPFPEYPFKHLSKQKNPVYAAVRSCLAGAELDQGNFGSPEWNPLGAYISPGQNVFVLCNFVQHRWKGGMDAFHAKCTHASVIRALIDYILIALKDRGKVHFGNAPIQSCEWEKVVQDTGAARVAEFYRQFGTSRVPVALTDLRQHIIRHRIIGSFEPRLHRSDTEMCVEVDLGQHSLLEDLYQSDGEPEFRVLDYDHRRTQRCHGRGRHLYLIHRHILDADVLVSIPKLKTHEKVGMTCGIKGCVGAVGHKDCLAHHRRGSPRSGGDEYPDSLSFLAPISRLHDLVYTLPTGSIQWSLHLMHQWCRKIVRRFTGALSGSWPGNDTCWRMALDLARIVEYASRDGHLDGKRKRVHLCLTDGIVAGEGNGPLSPRPVRLGYINFADNVVAGDYANCIAMGIPPSNLPMVREAFRLNVYRIAPNSPSDVICRVNERRLNLDELSQVFGRKFRLPREWEKRRCS
ncbi:MAG: DUF362 domain-containing protein [Gemmatales bacterium]|nr:DUF362 domain-containing protein [Gemmatales bacterium]MDW8224198.1 DUF362 domain-containing protein [Gemmatales bacterium]